jgi:fumarylacetoacetase
METLAPFRSPLQRPAGDPDDPLAYLDSQRTAALGALDIELEVWLQTAQMREAGTSAVRLTRGNACEAAYWTPAQFARARGGSGLASAARRSEPRRRDGARDGRR